MESYLYLLFPRISRRFRDVRFPQNYERANHPIQLYDSGLLYDTYF